MVDPTRPTGAEILALRAEHGIGIIEAHKLATINRINAAITDAQTVDDLKPILRRLVDGILGGW